MAKWCEKKDPLFRLRIHSPANPMHGHIDTDIQQMVIEAPTDWEAWATLIHKTLLKLGYGQSPRLVLGFYLDLINMQDENFRWSMVKGIFEGLGFSAIVNDEGEVEIDLPKKYNSLPQEGVERTTPGGIILPKGLELPR